MPKKTFLPSAEGEIGHRRSDADIDADISSGGFVAEFARSGTAGCEERSLVSIRTAAEKFHGFVDGISMNQTEHGAEDFRVSKLAVGGQTVQNRGSDEISGFVFGDLVLRPSRMGFAPSPTPAVIRDSMRCLLSLVITGPI